MRYLIDMHTHTIVSGHAYSTVKEMIVAASEKGVTYLGFSEHACASPGGCNNLYFRNMGAIPREFLGVNILYGAEANILDYNGKIDLEGGTLRRLDYTIASMHLPCIDSGSVSQNTKAMIGALENEYVTIIGHPDDSRYPIDSAEVVKAAKAFGKIVEMNNSSLKPTANRVGARENYIKILETCAKENVPILLGSDAHFETRICDFAEACELLDELDFPSELILNSDFSKIRPYLRNYTLL